MITLKNCRLIPELTEGYENTIADIVLDGKWIKSIREPGYASEGEVIDLEGKTHFARLI